jgi:diamine N-acetyltransferase
MLDNTAHQGLRYVQLMSQTITIREITPENEAAVRALRVAPGQERFVESVAASLDEAERSPDAHPWFRAIYAGEQPVGFVMLSYNVPLRDQRAPWRYFLWRLLIDARHQRLGCGAAAMTLVIDVVRGSPGATDLFTSVHQARGGLLPSIVLWGSNRPAGGSTTRKSFGSLSRLAHRSSPLRRSRRGRKQR